MIEVDWWVMFIDSGIDPKSAEATRILRRSKGYVLVEDNLYKRGSASGILMKCVRTEEGMCGNHAACRTLVGKAFRSGFYWSTAFGRRRSTRLPVHKLPVLQQTTPCPGSQLYHHTTFMAVARLGPGHHRAFDNCTR
jgi:hypothetical protein